MDAGPLIFLAAMIAVLWFVLIRPQRRRQAAHLSMVSSLRPDDEVITAGGMYARIRSVADDHLVVEIAPGTEIRLAKEAVASVVRKDAEPAPGAQNGG
ncbi:MAG: preprotein translocase subunit YajC [Actinomycetota bacterium]|nr:preprotein translocase subunit YajC [Actinomycetota bacterium]